MSFTATPGGPVAPARSLRLPLFSLRTVLTVFLAGVGGLLASHPAAAQQLQHYKRFAGSLPSNLS